MLYDPKWGRPSVAGFRVWLERQDPDATFCYSHCDGCAVGQYLTSIGMRWRTMDDPVMLNNLNMFACRAVNGKDKTTFGAVLREIEHAEAGPA
jgi:hypothetical protein